MAKQAAIEQDGVILEALSKAMFKVELENGTKVDWDDYKAVSGDSAPARPATAPAAAYDDSDVPF